MKRLYVACSELQNNNIDAIGDFSGRKLAVEAAWPAAYQQW